MQVLCRFLFENSPKTQETFDRRQAVLRRRGDGITRGAVPNRAGSSPPAIPIWSDGDVA